MSDRQNETDIANKVDKMIKTITQPNNKQKIRIRLKTIYPNLVNWDSEENLDVYYKNGKFYLRTREYILTSVFFLNSFKKYIMDNDPRIIGELSIELKKIIVVDI